MTQMVRFLVLILIPVITVFAQTDDQVYEFIAVQEKPVIQRDATPVYPQSAIDAGVDGTVVVTIVIDPNGDVVSADIFESIPELDAAALTTARNKKFTPGVLNGSAVSTRMNIPIRFVLPEVYDTPVDDSPVASGGDVVDLTGQAVIIKAEPDRPRVNIISDRLKPEFDNISLEKSFAPELMGRAERIVIIPKTQEDEQQPIDIKQILNRSR